MADEKRVDKGLRRIQCGVFVVTAQQDGRDNGCVVNTVLQSTSNPEGLIVMMNKSGLTHDMVMQTKRFCVSVLDETAPYALFERFGMRSGRDGDKFEGLEEVGRAENGLPFLSRHACAMYTVDVEQTIDLGTHTLFAGKLTQGRTLSGEKAQTYSGYHENVRPKREEPKKQEQQEKKTGWVCTVCGYIYEGEELPADFTCPLCGHGAADFEKL